MQSVNSECGVEASNRPIHRDPWTVYLEYYRRYRSDPGSDHLTTVHCAGTLIDNKHIVTAAHCLKAKFSRLVARLGEYDTTTEIDCFEGVCADPLVRIQVAGMITHPEYDHSGFDIAVLRLGEEAPYTNFIRPICLPSGSAPDGTIFTASGWGETPSSREYSKVKKSIPLPNWDMEECKRFFDGTTVPSHIICAGGEKGLDTCRGDSGGPLTWIGERTELWGVTSQGMLDCGRAGFPAFYSNVSFYLDWIQSVLHMEEMDKS
ncbi:hypothetical protein K1T71_012493 [Dendrolimus kikuchii]|uniref:Uncharacterized protein n=1 Tax=Dendrolimus kikuchii TaxID=765133 RepID=A0ACC1CJP5_9NEOP|nr:hypothetical protein K1T71_012493 [Dendrolimus kikuchii]